MDKKQITAILLIDLSKAFDSLCHSTILCKLQNLGTSNFFGSKVILQIDNSPLVLQLHCQNHLVVHMAYLKAQFSAQRFSSCTWMIYPQSSSLLTSNLTLMTLRYIFRSRQRTLIHVYAKLLRISNMFQSSVALSTFWLILKKTKFVLFGVRQLIYKLPSNITVPFLGQDLVPVNSAKDLGVTLDSNLTFNGHIAFTNLLSFVDVSSNK